MYWDEQTFFQQYGNLFSSKFPNVEIQVVSMMSLNGQNEDREKAFDDLVEKEKPDVMMLDTSQYEKLAADNKLVELESLLEDEDFLGGDILPAVIDMLKEKGSGKLYGLSPTFYSQALFYNKDLFDKYTIDYPTDKMSWEDVLSLAKRFPTSGSEDERIYGFSATYSNAYSIGNAIGSTLGLSFTDTDGKQLTYNTDSWKKTFQIAVDAMKSDTLYTSDPKGMMGTSYDDYLKSDLFTMGRAAMTLNGSYAIDSMKQAKDALKDYKPFNLGIVTVPVDPSNPDVSTSFGVYNIFAINAQSPNISAAMELVKYINGDETAKLQSRSQRYGDLSMRTKYIKDADGVSLKPFYTLKPKPDVIERYRNIPSAFYQSFSELANTELMKVVEDKQSLDEALKTINEKGQLELDKARLAEKEEKEKEKAEEGKEAAK
nr:extracellular solute-binding protein [Paenibacillus oenotherae]